MVLAVIDHTDRREGASIASSNISAFALDAENDIIELPVVTDRSAAEHAGVSATRIIMEVRRNLREIAIADLRGPMSGRCSADISTDIETGPAKDLRGNGRRSLVVHRKIGSEGRRCADGHYS
jgi:hypothetical protein